MARIKHAEHDLGELAKLLDGLQLRLREFIDRDPLSELIPLWKRPGWTTPAEFHFVRESLVALDAQIGQLERSVDVTVRGADLVGRQL